MTLSRILSPLSLAIMALLLSSCTVSPPGQPLDLCKVFQEKDQWYSKAQRVHNRYGIPINVAMAIMYHESGYVDDAKPAMRYFLFIPYGRGSSAYGYAQAQDAVWGDYLKDAGSILSSRGDFGDSLDFIGWYMARSKKLNGIEFTDVYNQYLNYHEGWTGFRRGSYKNKDWLIKRAKSVNHTAAIYRDQLSQCKLY